MEIGQTSGLKCLILLSARSGDLHRKEKDSCFPEIGTMTFTMPERKEVKSNNFHLMSTYQCGLFIFEPF